MSIFTIQLLSSVGFSGKHFHLQLISPIQWERNSLELLSFTHRVIPIKKQTEEEKGLYFIDHKNCHLLSKHNKEFSKLRRQAEELTGQKEMSGTPRRVGERALN